MNTLLLIYLIQSLASLTQSSQPGYPSLRTPGPLDEVLPSTHICVYFSLFLQRFSLYLSGNLFLVL